MLPASVCVYVKERRNPDVKQHSNFISN